jgi:phytanoyl-CoA hydroxylase
MAASSAAVATVEGQTYTGPVAQDTASKKARKELMYNSRIRPRICFAGLAAVAESPDEILAEFNRAGFVVITNLADSGTTKELQEAISTLCSGLDPEIASFEPGYSPAPTAKVSERASHVRKLCNYRRRASEPAEGSGAAEISAACRSLCTIGDSEGIRAICRLLAQDDSVSLVQEMALVKRHGSGGEKPPHADGAYFQISNPERLIGCWLAADAATPDNGCMFFLPESHAGSKFREVAGSVGPPHHALLDCQVPDTVWDASSAVCVELAPGDAVFFTGLTLHGTPPNLSEADRGALQVHYASSACKPVSSNEHKTMYGGFACIHPVPGPTRS